MQDDIDGDPLEACLACSDFLAAALRRAPTLLQEFRERGELDRPLIRARLRGTLEEIAAGQPDEPGFMAELRRLRRRHLARIAWRDLMGIASLEETLADLSLLADECIAAAHRYATSALTGRYGVPRDGAGAPLELMVLGMGKLGGGELNFSSDVDLVFLYPDEGDPEESLTDGRKRITHQEYFTRHGQMLIRLLDAVTEEGFVYRVDMRLRPFGDSGPLVAGFGAFEDYLQQHGRDWERYAYVKARPVAGESRFAELYEQVLRPFVYRRYLDFGVFESLREMKELIAREVARRDLQDNVKLGPGGIREVEFVVQAMQLIRGGSDARLQNPSLLAVLPQLVGAKLMDEPAVAALGSGYRFLRRLENRLQMVDDAQVHDLPVEPAARERLALSMGHPAWSPLADELKGHRAAIRQVFEAVVFAPRRPGSDPALPDLGALWQEDENHAAVVQALAAAGVADAEAAGRQLAELSRSGYARRLDTIGRRRLVELLPLLVRDVVGAAPDEGGAGRAASQLALLRRLATLLESIGGRTAYLALLIENPSARTTLVRVCGHGDFLVRQMAAFPILLDELIDDRLLENLPDRAQLALELDARLEQAAGDLEREVDALRHFRRAARFRVALLDLEERLPLMAVSDRLTEVAELILSRAMQLAWQQLVAVHGAPGCTSDGVHRQVAVAAIGYGKLGGLELGYASDLDLVFLHDSTGEAQETAGPKVVDNAVFMARFGQRLVHLLTVHTAAGRLYEVDMRLRPSGKGGLVVTQVEAFAEYQRSEAWTWEHQALLHSRAVAGDAALRARFEAIRQEILVGYVRRDGLREEVASMRERMRSELSEGTAERFDLKQDRGGLADIEFLAQYWVLRWAGERPALCLFPDTIRQLESVGSAALVDHGVIDRLVDAYRDYRRCLHRRSLEELGKVVPADWFPDQRAAVSRVWQQVMAEEAEPSL
ncbi:MAG: bifunctional [glutamate--ammonia ligase]-adenylyl-L-tyrosine phosphorylase/[glutamate--ammonia-ligase] adenylyltransferase [Steroidobacteraceae bacterium]